MAKFRGYAQRGGFNPLQVPDTSQKILDQGRDQIRGMDRAQAALEKNRSEYLSAMQNAQQQEQESRRIAYETDTRQRDAYRQAVANNYETSLKNNEQRSKQQQDNLKLLSSFSKTAFEAYSAFEKQKEDNRRLAYENAVYESGLTLPELVEIHKLDQQLTESDLRQNQTLQDYFDRGGSVQAVKQIQKFNGSRLYVDSKAAQVNLVSNIPRIFEQLSNKKYQIPGKPEMSLSEAEYIQDDAAVRSIFGQIRNDIFRSTGMLNNNPQFNGAFIHGNMRKYEKQWWSNYHAKVRKTQETQLQLSRDQDFKSAFGSDGISGMMALVENAPNKTLTRKQMLEYAARAASSGSFVEEDFRSLMDYPITISGDTKTFFERYGDSADVQGVRTALDNKVKQDLNRDNLQRNALKNQRLVAEDDIIKQLASLPSVSSADVEAAEKKLDSIYPGMDSSRLESILKNETTDAMQLKQIEKTLESYANANLLTTEMLEEYPIRIREKFQRFAQKQQKITSTPYYAETLKAIDDLVKSPPQIAAKADGVYDPSVRLMSAQLGYQFKKRVSELIRIPDFQGDPVQQAYNEIKARFEAQASNVNFFSGSGYSAFNVKASDAQTAKIIADHRINTIDRALKQPNVLSKPGSIFDEAQLVDMEKGYGKPGWSPSPLAIYAGNILDVDPLTVINKQRIAVGLTALELPKSLKVIESKVNPEFQRFLYRYQTPERTTRALGSIKQFQPDLIPRGLGSAIADSASRHGVNPALLAGVIDWETRGRWNDDATSPVGAAGIAQVMPATAAEFGLANPRDPLASIDFAGKYLKYLINYFNGNERLAVFAYNGGMGNIKKYGGPIPGNSENQEYYSGVMKSAYKFGYGAALNDTSTLRSSFKVVQYVSGDPAIKGANSSSVVYDPDGHGGKNYHNHYEFATREQALAAKARFEKNGFRVTSFLRPGDSGAHGSGFAIDVAPPLNLPANPAAEAAWSAKANALIGYSPN